MGVLNKKYLPYDREEGTPPSETESSHQTSQDRSKVMINEGGGTGPTDVPDDGHRDLIKGPYYRVGGGRGMADTPQSSQIQEESYKAGVEAESQVGESVEVWSAQEGGELSTEHGTHEKKGDRQQVIIKHHAELGDVDGLGGVLHVQDIGCCAEAVSTHPEVTLGKWRHQ